MIEDDLPLVELRHVIVKLVVAGGKRPDVVAVAAGVVRKERNCVHAFGGEIVDGADQPLAFVAFPRRVAGPPVLNVRREGVERHRGLERNRAVEVGVGQQRLG